MSDSPRRPGKSSHLDRIVAQALSAMGERQARVPLDELKERVHAAPAARPFVSQLLSGSGLIAEIKRASPSKGSINSGLDPAKLAQAYESGGAACLSVLTDQPNFGGSLEDLAKARAACALPVLRKDFLVTPYQLYESRAWRADAVLLIAAAAPLPLLLELRALARQLGLAVLFEIHDESELEAARACEPNLLGVNARNLRTLEVDAETFARLAPLARGIAPLVAESGVRSRADVLRYRAAGAEAVLVGEALSGAADPERATRALVAP